MKNKIIFSIPCIVLVLFIFFGNESYDYKIKEETTVYKTEYIYHSNESFLDSIDLFIRDVKISKKIINKSKVAVLNNKGYKNNLNVKKKVLKKEIDTLIVKVVDVIEYKVVEKTRKYKIDSTCVSERGFIGSGIFGKDKCKRWDIKKYYFDKDSTKIYKK